MILKTWDALPEALRTEEVRPYYDLLQKRKGALLLKRLADVLGAAALLALVWPILGVIAVVVRLDSPGPVFFRQVRVTQYGRTFRIWKFRTMEDRGEQTGSALTVQGDRRITPSGSWLRRWRLDELPQLLNILRGDMTFVGTRPEIPRYVAAYTPRMLATLLLPAGVTSEASIRYKDEAQLLAPGADADETYLKVILPGKMQWNLAYLERFSLLEDMRILLRTLAAVLR